MPVTQNFVATTDNYPADNAEDKPIIGPFQNLKSVGFTVANATVYAQIAKKDKAGRPTWDEIDIPFVPGNGGYSDGVYGIKFKSAVAGTPAVVSITGYFIDDPVPFSSPTPFTGTLTPGGGGFTPGNIAEIGSSGGSIAVTDPNGPITDLNVNGYPFLRANTFTSLLDDTIVIAAATKFLQFVNHAQNGAVSVTDTFTLLAFGSNQVEVSATGIGFFTSAPVAKPTVTGSRGGNAALASLLTALANLGLITNSTTV